MRERAGCLILVCLAACGEVKGTPDDGGPGDGSMPGDGGVDGQTACTPSACASGYCEPATDMCLPETSAIYVDPTGSDSGTCGTKAAPCSTIGGTAGAL